MNLKIAKRGLRLFAALVLLGAGAAQAGVYPDFVGTFDPSNWDTSNVGGFGSAFFTGNTQLNIIGPNTLPQPPSSEDAAVWPIVQNLDTPVIIHFSWTATIGDGAASATYNYVLNGVYTVVANLNQNGGPASGTVDLGIIPGDTLAFDMQTVGSVPGKTPPSFVISQFSFDVVPEPSTWIAGGLLVVFSAVGWHRGRTRPSALSA
jgi:hypothetical protein